MVIVDVVPFFSPRFCTFASLSLSGQSMLYTRGVFQRLGMFLHVCGDGGDGVFVLCVYVSFVCIVCVNIFCVHWAGPRARARAHLDRSGQQAKEEDG